MAVQLNKSNYVNKEKNNFNNIYYQQYINNNDTKSISTISESDDITTIINKNNNISLQNIKKSKPKLFIDKYKNISNAIDSWYNKNEIYTPKRYNRLKEGKCIIIIYFIYFIFIITLNIYNYNIFFYS
jgi:hypothetical protein